MIERLKNYGNSNHFMRLEAGAKRLFLKAHCDTETIRNVLVVRSSNPSMLTPANMQMKTKFLFSLRELCIYACIGGFRSQLPLLHTKCTTAAAKVSEQIKSQFTRNKGAWHLFASEGAFPWKYCRKRRKRKTCCLNSWMNRRVKKCGSCCQSNSWGLFLERHAWEKYVKSKD